MRDRPLLAQPGPLFLAFVAACAALALPALAGRFGGRIPQLDLSLDYTWAVVWGTVLACSLLAWPARSRDRVRLLGAWGLRLLIALVVMLPYESFYELDAFYYFDLASKPVELWGDTSLGTRIVVAIARIQDLVWPHSYHALKVTFAFIGLGGAFLFYRAIAVATRNESRVMFFAVTSFPSIAFWSSTIGKDPIVFFGVAVYAYGVVMFVRQRRIRNLGLIASGIAIAAVIRPWLAPILIAPMLVFALRVFRGVLARTILALVLVAGLLLAANWTLDFFEVASTDDLVAVAGSFENSWLEGDTPQLTEDPPQSIADLLLRLPIGMFSALFRPLPGEIGNLFGLVAAMENLVLLSVVAIAALRTSRSTLRDPLIRWAGALIVVWSAAYGLIALQNLGAASRFKLQVLPLLLGMALHLASRSRRGSGPPVGSVKNPSEDPATTPL